MESNFDFERKIKERTNKTFTGVIYKYTSPSNKVYIGQTTDEEMRKYRFKTSVNYGGLKIDNARKKYDISEWKYEVLAKKYYINEEDATNDLDLLETYYISKYDSYKNGYNSTTGGDGARGQKISEETKEKLRISMKGENNPFYGRHHTEETKKKIRENNKWYRPTEETRKKLSEKSKGRHHTEEAKKKISETKKLRCLKGEKSPLYGTHLSEETKKKIGMGNRGNKRIDNYRAILQIDMETGEVIKEWEAIKIAAESLNLHCPNIINVCKGISKQSGGFIWRYKDGK